MITDYLGNEIKEGMEFCIITVLNRQRLRFLGWMVNGKIVGNEEPQREDIPCWQVGKYFKIESSPNGLQYTDYGENYTGIHGFPPFLFDEETQIIAIKGVSDSEEIYLKSRTNVNQ